MDRVPTLLVLVVLLACLETRPAGAHGDLHERIVEVTEVIARQPGQAALYYKRGGLYLEHEEFDLALADFERVQRLDPTWKGLDLLRARALFRRGSAEEALVAVGRHLQQQPDDPEACVVQARALAATGRFAKSVAAYDVAMARLPQAGPDYCIERARASAAMGEAGMEEAVRGLDRAMAQLGPLVVLQQEAVDLEARVGHYDAAVVRVDRILAAGGRHETWLLRKAELLAQAGRRQEALGVCAAAEVAVAELPERIRRTPACEQTVIRLGVLRVRLEQGAAP